MRILVSLLLVLVMMLGMSGCGGKDAATEYEMSDIDAMVEAGAFSETLEEIDSETAFIMYDFAGHGIRQEDIEDCKVLRSAGATCEEVAILQLADGSEEVVPKVEEALKEYLDGQIASNKDYRPNDIPKLEDALVDSDDEGRVIMVVANNLKAAESACS